MGNLLDFSDGTQEKNLPIPSASEIKALILLSQSKLKLNKNKLIYDIKKRIPDIIEKLSQNNTDGASLKMMLNIQDEKKISVYDALIPICETLKEKYVYLYNSDTIPIELRASVDTLVYASTRLEIQELLTIRNALRLKFGNSYINKADENKTKLVNKNIIESLEKGNVSELLINIRLKQLCKEAEINCEVPNIDYSPVVIPDDSWEVLYVDNDPMKQFNPMKSQLFNNNNNNLNNDNKNNEPANEELDLKFNPYGSIFKYFSKEQVKSMGSKYYKYEGMINESAISKSTVDFNEYQYNNVKNKIDNLLIKQEEHRKSLEINKDNDLIVNTNINKSNQLKCLMNKEGNQQAPASAKGQEISANNSENNKNEIEIKENKNEDKDIISDKGETKGDFEELK